MQDSPWTRFKRFRPLTRIYALVVFVAVLSLFIFILHGLVIPIALSAALTVLILAPIERIVLKWAARIRENHESSDHWKSD